MQEWEINEIKEILEKHFDKEYWNKISITINDFLEILIEGLWG